ncbi:MAG: Phytoene/squalene synthetase [Ignavibacteria bacterium]|nr:MAG: Phytoene/squalene synthetase [Ignavibacteria bacterium]KAF0161344.1 MAG: Phytoene/squalene synthetase [Ignavibacteria bacterium]
MLTESYKNAEGFAKSHYENFPVISLTLPKEARKHIAVIYQFARQADDITDEGEVNSESRTESLELYESQLADCSSGKFANDFWAALYNTINDCKLNKQYLYDLLSAFKQDIHTKRYSHYENLLDYCRRSANPVGRLVLEVCGVRNEEAFLYSDSICTALQLTNFYQDVSVDIQKGRIYIPQIEMTKFGVEEKIFEEKQINANFKSLLKYQIDRTRLLFVEGRKLLPLLPKPLLVQIKMTILGGEKILDKIVELDYNVLAQRPKLNKFDYIRIFTKGLLTDAK